ncbi:Protein windpipe [Pseudolycoriella hygida]|uniref:Protein windpipe n=1 Tax=Pseudolycoriella hygida TaxID=35572 RepID=A0A9Q0N3P8_9DIPT|nr:Protein windpipe [Pseudolycoriella hygida]
MSSYFWFLLLLMVTAATSECPQDCNCSKIRNQQTPHHDHATCTTLQNVKRNFPEIHSLDLSSTNLETIPVELSLLQNVTHLDLSKNHLTKLTKLNSRIRSLDLSHNRLTSSEILKILPKIRILNLSYNQITHLPLDVTYFKSLKSINLIGNRIDCSCETLIVRDWLHQQNVHMNKHLICASPMEVRHQPWDKVSRTKMCSTDEEIENVIESHSRSSREVELSDFIAEEFLPYDSHSILKRQVPSEDILNDEGSGLEDITEEPVDALGVMDVGSGEGSGTDPDIDIEAIENVSPEDYDDEEEELEASGSGFGAFGLDDNSVTTEEEQPTTEEPDDRYYDEITKKPVELNIFEGNRPQDETTLAPVEESVIQKIEHKDTQRVASVPLPPAETAPIELANNSLGNESTSKPADKSKSTYILLAVLGILLVSLILFVVIKRRKSRRRPYSNNDAENIREIEMLDMKKNTNGKPANAEIVPLMPKKDEPKIERGMGSPNKEINSNIQPLHPTSYPKVDAVPLKQNDVPQTNEPLPENNNNFTEIQPEPTTEIPKPVDEIDENKSNQPIQNGHNGHLSDDEVFLPKEPEEPQEPAIKRYSPVYSPETGRVKIKLTETPKPKTPMLVTRSRSNAGAYITTPNLNIRSTSANGQ